MESLTKIDLPISILTCKDCLAQIKHERTEVDLPFHATSVEVESEDELEPLTVELDVREISWLKQSEGRYAATALISVSCPCCNKARDLRPYLEAPSILLMDIGRCRACKSRLELEDEEIKYLDSDSGQWVVDIRATLVCRTCVIKEEKKARIPIKSWDEFCQAGDLEVSLADSSTWSEFPINPKHVFISYSHEDARWLERLRVHLKPLERLGTITFWDDTSIPPGDKWREEIQQGLESSNAAILLVSADFLASDFITNIELPSLLNSAKSKGVVILSLIVSPCRYMETKSISQFQAMNSPSQPLSTLTKAEQEDVFVEVSRVIEKVLKSE